MKKLWIAAVALSTALTACSDDSGTTTSVAPNPDSDSAISDESSSSITNGTSSSTAKTEESSSSRIADINSSSSTPEIPATFSNKSIIKDGEVVDLRDGKTYKTIVIGNQVWMAENLQLDVSQFIEDGLYDNESDFYEVVRWNEETSDTNEHYYPWDIAIDAAGVYGTDAKGCGFHSKCQLTGTVRGICPEGFHVPTPTEAEQLIRAIGGKCGTAQKLKAKHPDWKMNNGTDEFGFAALPAGYYAVWWGDGMDGYTFEYERDVQAKFLTTVNSLTWNIAVDATYESGVREEYEVVAVYDEPHVFTSSLRCVRDEPAGVDWVDPPLPTAPALPEFEYGEFTDERDGQTYKTVIVNGKTWMDQNLNYAFDVVDTNASCKTGYEHDCKKDSDYSCKHPFIGSPVSCKNEYSIDSTYCKEHETNCKNYGKLYTWKQALVACPIGWHLPNDDEIEDFMDSVNPYSVYEGECLLRHTKFTKLEDIDLNKLLNHDLGTKEFGIRFWTSDETDYNANYANTSGFASLKKDLNNVRCVKD